MTMPQRFKEMLSWLEFPLCVMCQDYANAYSAFSVTENKRGLRLLATSAAVLRDDSHTAFVSAKELYEKTWSWHDYNVLIRAGENYISNEIFSMKGLGNKAVKDRARWLKDVELDDTKGGLEYLDLKFFVDRTVKNLSFSSES